jgi:hypothetical protein
MIQLNDLRKELTEILDDDLVLVVGGGSGLTPIGYNDLTFKTQGTFGGASQYSAAWQNGYGWGVGINTSGTVSGIIPLGNSSSAELQYNPSGSYQGTVKVRIGNSPSAALVQQINPFASPF